MPTKSKPITLVMGVFNVLHPGHFRFLEYAKTFGNDVFVALTPTEQGDADTLHERVRLKNLRTVSYVDHAFITHKSLEELIEEIKPAILLKGWE